MLPEPASFISDFWNDTLVANDRQWLFLVLVGFIGSFGFIRMSTRLMRSPKVPWWPGSIESGGVHVHHLVFGIVLMMIAGTISFAGFAVGGIYEVCAVLFGVGIGLTIDEFALWVHLDDVYWSEEGRRSIDATIIAAAALGLILIGVQPFDWDSSSTGAVILSIVLILLHFGCVAICFYKGRIVHGLFGILIPPLDIYGACRLAKPTSPWARRFYGERKPNKQARAEKRFHPGRRTDRFKEWLRTVIGGSTESDYLNKIGLAPEAATAEVADDQGNKGD